MNDILALMIPIVAILVFGSPLYLRGLSNLLIEWRKAGNAGGKEVELLRQEVAELRSDYQQLKADHNDVLLGLNKTVHHLELRLDHQVGIDTPAPDPEVRAPAQRQL